MQERKRLRFQISHYLFFERLERRFIFIPSIFFYFFYFFEKANNKIKMRRVSYVFFFFRGEELFHIWSWATTAVEGLFYLLSDRISRGQQDSRRKEEEEEEDNINRRRSRPSRCAFGIRRRIRKATNHLLLYLYFHIHWECTPYRVENKNPSKSREPLVFDAPFRLLSNHTVVSPLLYSPLQTKNCSSPPPPSIHLIHLTFFLVVVVCSLFIIKWWRRIDFG